jgi:hypothetical protein
MLLMLYRRLAELPGTHYIRATSGVPGNQGQFKASESGIHLVPRGKVMSRSLHLHSFFLGFLSFLLYYENLSVTTI